MIDDQELQLVTDRVSIYSIASQYLSLKKCGEKTWKCNCPFHSEKTPSFYVYEDTQSFVCYGCSCKGKVVVLKSRLEGISFNDALKELKIEAGIIDAFVPHSMRKSLQAKHLQRQQKMKRFHVWRSKLIADLIAYTNTQWKIYRISKRQQIKNTTEELEGQIETCYYEATTREKALDELETMADSDLVEWFDTQKSWEKGGAPKWYLTGWRKQFLTQGSNAC